MREYDEHISLAEAKFKQWGLEFDPKNLTPPVLHDLDPQVVVVQAYVAGPAEVDVIPIIGLYIPHDGQCTVVVNHMDGAEMLDNADLMFPEKN